MSSTKRWTSSLTSEEPVVLSRELSAYEKGWLWGMFDGEGMVGAYPGTGQLRLQVTSQHVPTLLRFQSLLGGTVTLHNRAGKRGELMQHADSFQWRLGPSSCSFVLALEVLAEGCVEKWSQLKMAIYLAKLPRGDMRKKLAAKLIQRLKRKDFIKGAAHVS